MPKKPNILFLQVDQLAAAYLRTYGNAICKADNIEALAAGGVVFERAYCNFPLCAPSRFSMATGQLCSATGTYDNAAEMPATIPTYAHYLRTAGYQTALSGKMLHRAGSVPRLRNAPNRRQRRWRRGNDHLRRIAADPPDQSRHTAGSA
jgi:arylsulfatase A-like enzyme